jgi:micrococcal nuclease
MFTYNATITHVVDGDTVDAFIDLGFGIHHVLRLRLNGIDTPEVSSQAGRDARDYVRTLLEGKAVVLTTFKPDKYGRYLADIVVNGIDFNASLVEQGYAREYDGGRKAAW